MEKAASLVFQFFLLPVLEVLLFLFPLLFLGAVVRFLKGKIDDILINDAGKVPYYVFAAVGTPVHEMSHLLACFLFRHKVRRFSLFFPDKGGRLGYVEHLYDPGSLYQNAGCFFIGLAPIAGGAAVLYFAALWFYPSLKFDYELPTFFAGLELRGLYFVKSYFLSMGSVFAAFFRDVAGLMRSEGQVLKPALFLFLVAGVGSHMFPSTADFKGMAPGLLVLYVLVCLGHLTLYLLGMDLREALGHTAAVSGFVLNILIFIVFMLGVVLAGLVIFKTIKKLTPL